MKSIISQNFSRFYRNTLLSLTHLKLLGSMLWECVKTKRVLYSLPHSSAVCISSPLGTKTLTLRTAQNSDPTAETLFSKPITHLLVTFWHPSPHFEEGVTHFTQRGTSSMTCTSVTRQSEASLSSWRKRTSQKSVISKALVIGYKNNSDKAAVYSNIVKIVLLSHMCMLIVAIWVTSMRPDTDSRAYAKSTSSQCLFHWNDSSSELY